MAWLLVVIQVVLPVVPGGFAWAQEATVGSAVSVPAQPTVTAPVVVNRESSPSVPLVASPSFSASPTDEEIVRARVFSEPLYPVGVTTGSDNADLAQAVTVFLQRTNSEDFGALTQFLESHPQSAWRASLLTHLGIVWRHQGRFSRALTAWEEAWELGKAATDANAKLMADRALAETLGLNARLGRYERLEALFAETTNRVLNGSISEKVSGAREGLWLMRNRPEDAFRCGPMALNQICALVLPQKFMDQKIMKSRSTLQGMSLSNVCELANALGLNYQMAYRSPGSKIIFPAVVHWKAGHYAALIREVNGRYKIQDPTFGDELWVTLDALNEEASGYFLVPAGDLPAGWRKVAANEGGTVWGKGNPGSLNPNNTSPNAPGAGGSGGGTGWGSSDSGNPPGAPPVPPLPPPPPPLCPMAQYTMQAMLVNLHIWDTPVGYSPPVGLDMHFQLEYNQREAFQPATFNYSSLGSKWTFNWLSYVTDDPANLGAPVTSYLQGGGTESYAGFDTNRQSYAAQPSSQVILQLTSSNSYARLTPQGYQQIYSRSDGSTTYPRKVFLTQVIDPVGNTLTIAYDANNRISTVTDAIGQVTTLAYASTNLVSPLFYQIAKVTDPFGRFATFAYNAANQLTNITDIIGISSQFTYGLSDQGAMDFITSLTTPYGTTTFAEGANGLNRWLQATDPMGQTERMEFRTGVGLADITDYGQAVPTTITDVSGNSAPQWLYYRNSFFWDKKTWQLYPGDLTKARLFHWLHEADINTCSGIEESVKGVLEGRTWFTYPGQTNYTHVVGSNNLPATVARILEDGTSQISRFQYNGFGNVISLTDPIGRVTTNLYATNLIDLLMVKQQNGAGFDTLASFTYNSQHLPLTTVDAAGRTNFFAYNARGQLTALTNALNQTVTMSYNTNGYLTNLLGSLPGSTTSFTYDSYGRVRTVTDSKGYTLTTSYDAADRATNILYPDGSYNQVTYNNLDPVLSRDRNGHWTSQQYDALRHLTDVYDNLGRHTHFEHCSCGALESITDSLGRVTAFVRDLEKRVTTKVYPDNTQISYAYATNSGRLLSLTDAKGQTAQYQYFIDDNLKRVSYTNAAIATPAVAFTYDTNYNRMLTMVDGIGTNTYGYYPVTTGQLGAGKLSSVDGPFANDTITYNYDALGRVTNRAINGMAQQVTYDVLGRVTQVTNALGSFTNTYVGTTGQVSTNFYPNGQKTIFSYLSTTNDERLAEILNQNTGGATLSNFDYGYDAAGQITNWTQQADAATPTAYTYQYDAGNQLLNAVLKSTGAGATVLKQYAYGYDLAGNRTSEQIDNGVSQASYNSANQLTTKTTGSGSMQFAGMVNEQATVSVGGNTATVNHQTTNFTAYANVTSGTNVVPVIATDYNGNAATNKYQLVVTNTVGSQSLTFDPNGNLTNDGAGLTYEYDALNRTTAINRGTTNRTEFAYDGAGRRVQVIEKTNGAAYVTNKFVWCGTELCEQRNLTGATVTKRFFGQGEQIAGVNYYFTRDHLGSVREMTDNLGTIQVRYDYDPYGRRTKLSGSLDADFGFTGHFTIGSQPETTLTMYRLYRTDLGRWVTKDPSGEQGGINLYGYGANSPIDNVDPSGLAWYDGIAALTGFGGPGTFSAAWSGFAEGWSKGGQGVANDFTGGLFNSQDGLFYNSFDQQDKDAFGNGIDCDEAFRFGSNAGRVAEGSLLAAAGPVIRVALAREGIFDVGVTITERDAAYRALIGTTQAAKAGRYYSELIARNTFANGISATAGSVYDFLTTIKYTAGGSEAAINWISGTLTHFIP